MSDQLVNRLIEFAEKTPFHDTKAIIREAAAALSAQAVKPVADAREAFLDLMADADWKTETDGDETGVITTHTIITGDTQLAALARAVGIEARWRELTEDAITRALDEGPKPATPPASAGPALAQQAPEPQGEKVKPLRYCDYCKSWNSKPCGEQCVWTPDMPTDIATRPQPVASPVTEAMVEAAYDKLREFLSLHPSKTQVRAALEAALSPAPEKP